MLPDFDASPDSLVPLASINFLFFAFCQIAVPQPLIGHIIGKGGVFVREVLSLTSVQVRNHFVHPGTRMLVGV